ncbi:MAG TPA: STAS domain-containing protein [Steroidobacteraceae bacterium]|nr:STAS domain-containing protein [Steroidobacteraceae bacterium]
MSEQLLCQLTSGPDCLQISGEMTVHCAQALYQQWRPLLSDPGAPARVDMSEVTEIDTAGLQLLLLARRTARSQGRPFAIVASPVVRSVLELCRLAPPPGEPSGKTP